MTRPRCWGIYRERAHSPGRESDDERILGATAAALERLGFDVVLKTPAQAVRQLDRAPPRIMLMCERRGPLSRLRKHERAGGVAINPPGAVLSTYRIAMLDRLAGAGIPLPAGTVVLTGTSAPAPSGPVWVKRADVHNTQAGDVVLVASGAEMHAALRQLAARGIGQAIVQEHLPGDLIKFYGVGDGARVPGVPPWFRWFYHRDQTLEGYAFDPARLESLARRAAAALGLEIYGGDVIVTPRGELVLIDLNAWPSFALFRDEAAGRIAGYAAARFTGALLSRSG